MRSESNIRKKLLEAIDVRKKLEEKQSDLEEKANDLLQGRIINDTTKKQIQDMEEEINEINDRVWLISKDIYILIWVLNDHCEYPNFHHMKYM